MAEESSEVARGIVDRRSGLARFAEGEIITVCGAIVRHQARAEVYGVYDQLLKDADVLGTVSTTRYIGHARRSTVG